VNYVRRFDLGSRQQTRRRTPHRFSQNQRSAAGFGAAPTPLALYWPTIASNGKEDDRPRFPARGGFQTSCAVPHTGCGDVHSLQRHPRVGVGMPRVLNHATQQVATSAWLFRRSPGQVARARRVPPLGPAPLRQARTHDRLTVAHASGLLSCTAPGRVRRDYLDDPSSPSAATGCRLRLRLRRQATTSGRLRGHRGRRAQAGHSLPRAEHATHTARPVATTKGGISGISN
jgi:hypothetical protein